MTRAIRVTVLAVSLATSVARAGNGPAFSGVIATADDATTAASNPAGLTRLEASELAGKLLSFFSDSTFETSASSIGPLSSSDESSSIFIPSLYYARPINGRVTFGASLSVPAGVGQDAGDDTPGRYLLEEWSLGYVSLAPAVGYRVNERLSLGAAVNLNYTLYSYESAVFNGTGEPDGKMELEDGDFGVGFQLGLLFEATGKTRFGLTYRSSSESDFSDAPELSGLTPEREAQIEAAGLRDQSLDLTSKFPQVVAGGLYHEFGNGSSVTFDLGWVDFAEFGIQELALGESSIEVRDTRYDSIWAASAGLSWPLGTDWKLRFGAAGVSSGVDDEDRSFAFRLDQVAGAGVGAEYRWGERKLLGFNLTYYDLGDAPVSRDVPQQGTLSGEYSKNEAIGFDLALSWTLD